MQLVSKNNILIALSVILIAAVAIIAFQADQPGVVAPAENWEQVIQQADASHETVLITTKEARLEADLFVPNGGEDAKSAVVFITGSGDTVYQNYGEGLIEAFVLDTFLPRDMSVLLVNKRGMGQSSGSWLNNDFQGRADDIYAAVKYLQELEDIDPANIGVMGHSQGGWIANLVAAQHDEVAFFISLAGPTTTVETQMQDTYQNVFACEGSEGDELDRRTKNQIRLTRLGAAVGSVLPFGVIGFDANIIDYDPEDAVRTAGQPGLFAFGEYDPFVPPESSQQRVDQLFGTLPPDNFTFVTISQANHRFKVVDSMCASPDIASSAEFSEQLTAVLGEWLDQIGYPEKEAK
jgi:pimeloyl-ACP methyl ester carboxylesterase